MHEMHYKGNNNSSQKLSGLLINFSASNLSINAKLFKVFLKNESYMSMVNKIF